MDVTSYIYLTEGSTPYPRSTAYVNALINLNYKFGVIPLDSEIFNPQLFDDLAAISGSLVEYGSSSGMGTLNDIDSYSSENTLEFDTSTGDQYFFASEEISGLVYDIFSGAEFSSVGYQTYIPDEMFMLSYDDTVISIDDIMFVFTNDSTRFQNIPVDLETSNIVSIPYRGLLLLNDIIDDDKLEINNL
jgi:hypothetical protein